MDARNSRRQVWLRVAIVATLAIVAGFPATRLPFGGDDQYILARAASPSLADRLAVYTVEVPSPLGQRIGAWWMGFEYHRNFVRLVPSLVMSAERATFGMWPRPFHLVSLLLHTANAILLYALLRRLAPHGALIAAMLFAAHPAINEMVSWLAVTGTLVGTLFALVALLAAIAPSSPPSRWSVPTCVAAAVLSMTSYEAMVGLPLLILALRWARAGSPERPAPWQRRELSWLALWPPYFALRWALGATDLSLGSAFPKDQVLPVLFGDAAAYLVRSVGWGKAQAMWFHGEAPLVASIPVVLAFVCAAAWVGRRNRIAWFGLLVATCFLAAPIVVRATVGVLNSPSYRQLYPALVGLAIVLAAAIPPIRRPAVAAFVHIAAALTALAFAWGHGMASTLWGSNVDRLSNATRLALRDAPPHAPVLWVGAPLYFPYSTTYDGDPRDELYLVPPTAANASWQLCVSDATTVIATTSGDIVADGLFPAGNRLVGRMRLAQHRLPMLDGAEDLSPYLRRLHATVRPASRHGDAVSAVAFQFDAPVRELAFLEVGRDLAIHRLEPPDCSKGE